mmetsp:Transcript_10585/g.24735  ORF Transcript_10585/g.24735 Transcript_10585/m.24735 type:complete len:560 (-) Transcript_10585:86-1765(-)
MPRTPSRRRSSSSSSLASSTGSGSANGRSVHMQGILWKRRDFFRNRWRPRWFVLHSDQRLLAYYILANQESEVVSDSSFMSSPGSVAGSSSNIAFNNDSYRDSCNYNGNSSSSSNRRRTFSDSSNVSFSTIDCDVVPRGTIYLRGSTVEINEALTSTREDLYALTIIDHKNANHCHLATRTAESRDQWIHRIRLLCQRGNDTGRRGQPGTPRGSIRTMTSSQLTPISDRTERAMEAARNGTSGGDGNSASDENKPKALFENKDKAGTNIAAEDHLSIEKASLVLLAPLVVYRVLMAMSLFRLAALCFAVTSTMVLRWVAIQHLTMAATLFTDGDDKKSDGSSARMPRGRGSICCRIKEDLLSACKANGEAKVSHILVRALAEAVSRQPRLVSKKLCVLPSFYSTDIMYIDLNNNSKTEDPSHRGVLVSKADEKDISEIIHCFARAEKQQNKSSPITFVQQAVLGPAGKVVMASAVEETDDNNGFESVHLDMNIADCPITVFVSRTFTSGRSSERKSRKPKTPTFEISINIRSTDVNACRNFAKDFQRSIHRSDDVLEKR